MPSPRALLSLPAYVCGVSALFWVFQLAALTGFLRFWDWSARRNDIAAAVRCLKWLFKCRMLRLGSNSPYHGKCMYLANHRGWSDFFIDMYVSGCRGVPLSRKEVGMAFPAFTSSLLVLRSILLFNRAGIRDTEKFNRWLDVQLARGPQNSLLVYPEGTRSQKAQSLPLKRGMLRYAFTRRLPVQVAITAYKEEVLNERRLWVHFGRTLVTGFSEVLESARFDDFEAFMAAVQRLWDDQWAAVHAAPRHGLPELPEPSFPGGQYSTAQLATQTAVLAVWTAALVAGGRWLLRLLVAAATLLPAGRLLLAGLALYVAASLAAAALLPTPTSSRGPVRGGSAGAADKES